jgi:hypothetical protein
MDFLDPSNKRSYNIRLFIGFFLSASIIVLGTIILALITSGYTINTKTGQVIQNGLLFIDSTPTTAGIYINHKYVKNTNARLELRAGNYNISLYQPGYDTWTTDVDLLGGNIDEVSYPLLVPTKPLVSTITSYTTQPQVFTQTPNQHWLLVSSATANSFDVYDLTNVKTPVSTTTIPSNLLVSSAGPNTFSVIQWSSNNQDVLLEDQYAGAINYIVFNYLNPSLSYNLNQTFPITFNSVKLLNSNYQTPLLFDSTSGDLYLGDATAKTTSLILSKVIDYTYYGTNQFLYATADGTSTSETSIKFSNLTSTYLVKNVPIANKYLLNIQNYGGNYYYLVGGGGIYDYVYYNLPTQQNGNSLPIPYTLMVNNTQPVNVLNSTGQRYISLQSGNNFSVYDIQTQDHYRFSLIQSLSSPNYATWLDDNRLISFSNGEMIVFDFDGTNIFNIAEANNNFNGLFSPNYDVVYYFNYNSGNGSWILDRAGMVAGQH